MKTLLVGDRLGGVLFDIQQWRQNNPNGWNGQESLGSRDRLIATIACLVQLVEQIDEAELHSNPRIGDYERCLDSSHDNRGMRKTDCSECMADETPPGSVPRIATICKCTAPDCNAGNDFPKGCYECGGIIPRP